MRIGQLTSLIPRELPGLAETTPGLQTAGVAGVSKPDNLIGVGGAEKGGFSNLLQRAVSEVNGKMNAAQAEQAKVLTGESTNLHQAMISMQEASTAFTLMVEVRNKLVESYQELMRMQV